MNQFGFILDLSTHYIVRRYMLNIANIPNRVWSSASTVTPALSTQLACDNTCYDITQVLHIL